MEKDELISICRNCIQDASRAILEVYSEHIDVEEKEDGSPLTLADKKSHEIVVASLSLTGIPVLSEEGKEIPYNERKNWRKFWMVDPLDGTKEFVSGNGEFAVNIALIEDGRAIMGLIAAPVLNYLWWGWVDDSVIREEILFPELTAKPLIPITDDGKKIIRILTSRSHLDDQTQAMIVSLSAIYDVHQIAFGSSLKFPALALNKADIYLRFGPTMEWDVASGQAILEAAGGQLIEKEDGYLPLKYNKKNLVNPSFLSFSPFLNTSVKEDIIRLLSS